MNTLKKPSQEWYKKIWSLDIQDMSWVEHTKDEIDFIIDIMQLSGSERILDLACGFGRHAIERIFVMLNMLKCIFQNEIGILEKKGFLFLSFIGIKKLDGCYMVDGV
jgi:hypothetical protein